VYLILAIFYALSLKPQFRGDRPTVHPSLSCIARTCLPRKITTRPSGSRKIAQKQISKTRIGALHYYIIRTRTQDVKYQRRSSNKSVSIKFVFSPEFDRSRLTMLTRPWLIRKSVQYTMLRSPRNFRGRNSDNKHNQDHKHHQDRDLMQIALDLAITHEHSTCRLGQAPSEKHLAICLPDGKIQDQITWPRHQPPPTPQEPGFNMVITHPAAPYPDTTPTQVFCSAMVQPQCELM